MSVFAQASRTLTELGKEMGQSDHSLKAKYNGSAPMDHSITAETWLPGTKGVHCEVMKGDHWQENKGNVIKHVSKKTTATYDGEYNATHNGDRNTNVNAADLENVQGPTMISHLGGLVHTVDTHLQNDWTCGSFTWGMTSATAMLLLNLAYAPANVSMQAINISVTPICDLNIPLLAVSFTGLEYACVGKKLKGEADKTSASVVSEKIEAVEIPVGTVKGLIKFWEGKIAAAETSAAPRVGPYPLT